MKVLSLGWGVQSFTLAAMSALGEIDKVDVAIHADTTFEREATYQLEKDFSQWLDDHGVHYVRVVSDDLGLDAPPTFTSSGMPVTRSCTQDWKVMPVRRWIQNNRERKNVEMWIGISYDEWHRAKDSPVKYITNRFPLLEMKMTRQDCLNWLDKHGLPRPVKSSCTFCPYHSKMAWVELKKLGGRDWDMAVKVDQLITEEHGRYVHRSGVPLEVAVRIPEDYGMTQATFDQVNAVANAMDSDGQCDEGLCWT